MTPSKSNSTACGQRDISAQPICENAARQGELDGRLTDADGGAVALFIANLGVATAEGDDTEKQRDENQKAHIKTSKGATARRHPRRGL
jgi:hypothetical protein